MTFLHPNEPNLILYSKRTQLCVLDVTKGTTLWRYPIAAGQIIDKIVYTPQLSNVLVVSSSTIVSDLVLHITLLSLKLLTAVPGCLRYFG